MAAQQSDYSIQVKIYKTWTTPKLQERLEEITARDGLTSHSSGVGGSASWDSETTKMHKAAIVQVLEERGAMCDAGESDLEQLRAIELRGIGSNLIDFSQRPLSSVA